MVPQGDLTLATGKHLYVLDCEVDRLKTIPSVFILAATRNNSQTLKNVDDIIESASFHI